MAITYKFIPPTKNCILERDYIIETIYRIFKREFTQEDIDRQLTDSICQVITNNYFLDLLEQTEFFGEDTSSEERFTLFKDPETIHKDFKKYVRKELYGKLLSFKVGDYFSINYPEIHFGDSFAWISIVQDYWELEYIKPKDFPIQCELFRDHLLAQDLVDVTK